VGDLSVVLDELTYYTVICLQEKAVPMRSDPYQSDTEEKTGRLLSTELWRLPIIRGSLEKQAQMTENEMKLPESLE
jgi:hypothetical protein